MEDISFHVSSLKTSYRKFSISNVSFTLEAGDIFGLVGMSGSGKSTLIKTLVGLKKWDTGTIELFKGERRVNINDAISYSPQQNSLYPHLTLKENIFTFGELRGLKKKDITTNMNKLLKTLGLEDALNKRISALSGGMKKRADLCVAMINDPLLIVLDEPFNGLDISLQKFIWKHIKDLSKEGKIIIISSHIVEDIERYCNTYGLIAKGEFYAKEQIAAGMKQHNTSSLSSYLESLFTYYHNLND